MVELDGVADADILGGCIYKFVVALVVGGKPILNLSRAQKSHDFRVLGLLWMANFHLM